MTAGVSVFTFSVVYLFCVLFILSSVSVDGQPTDAQLCHMCEGAVQNHSAVWRFCLSEGRIEGRCCFQDEEENILGLDLSNCSLSHVEDLQEASAAVIVDLSSNPVSNMSDFIFQGFNHLSYLILPIKLDCPGGNTSWDRVDINHDTRFCEGQRNACNLTGQISLDCPENSVCMPYGPGFFQCSCAQNFHGYKCLREGNFPMLEVMATLGGSTVVVSLLLWITQRRKIKGT
ncbi:all-trans retinoic acid-induced differentiation factor [Hemibagrus wyckioides]|uniref:all-trans retinoic acid-induced differentiation factor n=1 Tax=Hemibagrus wyckioides TaxID=337641 RepID=UPI00266D88C1|nr:all-trans retinoic acid-induced differentiation factor [Hemibagrus wyckioides]